MLISEVEWTLQQLFIGVIVISIVHSCQKYLHQTGKYHYSKEKTGLKHLSMLVWFDILQALQTVNVWKKYNKCKLQNYKLMYITNYNIKVLGVFL